MSKETVIFRFCGRYTSAVVFDPAWKAVATGLDCKTTASLHKLVSDAFCSGMAHGMIVQEHNNEQEPVD